MTVTSGPNSITVASAGAALSPTLTMRFPRITIHTLCRGWAETPSIRLAAWMAMGFCAKAAGLSMARTRNKAIRRGDMEAPPVEGNQYEYSFVTDDARVVETAAGNP